MFQDLGLEGWTPAAAAVALGLLLGLMFGALAQRSRFCLRRALVGEPHERAPALGVWSAALAIAVAGTTLAGTYGLVSFQGHRFHAAALPVAAIILGGLLFGIGMVLARGCTSRLLVLAGTGNMRAFVAIAVFGIVAHATLKGVLAPARVAIGALTTNVGGYASLGALPGGPLAWAALLVIVLGLFVVRSGARISHLLMGAGIGALAVAGWVGTGFVLKDEFAPIPLESLAFTSAVSEATFWAMASSAIAPTFGVGLLAGVAAGSFLAALAGRELALVGFTTQAPVGRYIVGGALMGFGGVLAGGCTIGAGLSGVASLSVAALLALVSIVAGAYVPDLMAQAGASKTGASETAAPSEARTDVDPATVSLAAGAAAVASL